MIMPWGGGGSGPAQILIEKCFLKFGTFILCNVTKKSVEKKVQNCSYSDDDVTNYDFQDLFSAFETQDNTQIEYI